MTKFDEKIEKAVKIERKFSKQDYIIKPQQSEENKDKNTQNVTNLTLKKRGDYKDWEEN